MATNTTTGTAGTSGATAASTGDVRETHNLIASDKVEGTPVRRSDGEKIGTIERVMIEKRSGQVAYAVMSFGGFLGIGESYHPLPWGVLTYDTRLGGYVVDLSRERLEGAPRSRPLCGRPGCGNGLLLFAASSFGMGLAWSASARGPVRCALMSGLLRGGCRWPLWVCAYVSGTDLSRALEGRNVVCGMA
jgi:hypothetical protein